MMPTITVTHDVGGEAGRAVQRALARTLARRQRARLAVPGGTSPTPVFRWLSANLSAATLAALDVTWVDERHGPPADDWRLLPADANLRGTWEHWFQHLEAPPAHLSMRLEGPLPYARDAYAAGFAARFANGLDVVLLGAGADGHVGSLFPGHPALTAHAPCVAVPDSPKPPPERLTLSLPVLRAAHTTVLVATGASKASMLAQALDPSSTLPVHRAQPTTRWHWVVDPAAASQLPPEVLR